KPASALTMNALLSSVLLVLCAMTALASPVEERKADGDFDATCAFPEINIDSLTITALCQDHNGVFGPQFTTISLNLCVGVGVNGELEPGTDFSASCSNITSPDGFFELSADCTTPSGTTVESSLDLNLAITNTNGVLTCP
ncbi:hypothetical protein C8R45DRAFT_964371, partial [Mycena sanguinolenta]